MTVAVGAVAEELCWLDKPFPGALLLGGRLGEVVRHDLEVVEEAAVVEVLGEALVEVPEEAVMVIDVY